MRTLLPILCFMLSVGLAAAEVTRQEEIRATTPAERIRSEKVLVVEQTLAPGETLSLAGGAAGVVVYLDTGAVVTTLVGGTSRSATVQRGDVAFQPPGTATLKNSGSSALRIVRTEYLGKGRSENWGRTGLAPHSTLLFENQYGRVYGIRIPAETHEPRHTHQDRVVICLSGAELEHIMPDGRKETSTLKTGEIAWRRGATHVGHNLGKTDLWVIAIEPK